MARHDQLVKILGMLGSSHDGEVVAAARRAQAYLVQHKLRWSDVVAGTPERASLERRLLELREQARRTPSVLDKDEIAELKALIREFTTSPTMEPTALRRVEWLEAVVAHAAGDAPAA
jgi:hypothetical protein